MKSVQFNTRYVLLCFLLGLISCNDGELRVKQHEIEAYFYPKKDLETGKVYIYTPVDNDALESYMWYYKINYGYLSGVKYDSKFRVEQTSTEAFVKGGVVMNQLILCEYPSDTAQKCITRPVEILYDDTFPFQVKEDSTELYLYKLKWTSALDTTQEITVTRNRHFLGFTTYTYKDKVYDCVEFGIRETALVGDKASGYQTIPSYTTELYAKGLGLVYTKKNIDNAIVQTYELADRMTMEELEELLKERLQ